MKMTLFSTPQMANYHNLHTLDLQLNINNVSMERNTTFSLLCVCFHENMKWDEAVKKVASSCYATLAALRKIKHLVPRIVKII